MSRQHLHARRLAAALAALSLIGCASLPADGGYAAVQQLTRARGAGEPAWQRNADDSAGAERHVAALLAQPLTADSAVALALTNNRMLQASYAELGIAQADLAQAGSLPNPTLSFSRVRSADAIDIERKLLLPVMALLTMPIARQVEQQHLELMQLNTAAAALRVADATRRAYFGAIAARQTSQYMEQVKSAAQAGADLATRMAAAGNWSKLQQAREQAFLADSVAQLARARQSELLEREQLVRLLGLSSDSALQLPEQLPELPAAAREIKDAEAQALGNRLDILLAQKELAGLAASLGLTRSTRFVNLLDAGYLRNSGDQAGKGYDIELQIPLFDWGSARVARAEALYMQAVQRAAGVAVNARSDVRSAYAGYHGAWALARHYRDEVVPLKKRIADEQLLRYNGMLISVFELLADAREQVQSVNAAIEAQRDFWIADAALQAALTCGDATPPSAAAQNTH